MKKCPFCAEVIQDEAIKCRYCGECLDDKLSTVETVGKEAENTEEKEGSLGKYAYYLSLIGILLVFFQPIALILGIIASKQNQKYAKRAIVISSIILVLSILMFFYNYFNAGSIFGRS